jgi:PilZ domain
VIDRRLAGDANSMTPINLLTTCQVVRISVPLTGRRTLDLDGYPGASDPPFFELSFAAGKLPVDELNLGGQCKISFDVGGLIYVVRAQIDQILSPRKLRLAPVQSYSNIQKREFFRVDTELVLSYRAPDEEQLRPPAKYPVNLSGGGIRFPVDRRYRLRETLEVHIYLKDLNQPDAKCSGQIVRIDEMGDGQLGVALKFLRITPADQEKLISFCFSQQRELLRRRVQIKHDT